MQGTIYTMGIGNGGGTDLADVPLWYIICGDRCQGLLWRRVTGFKCGKVPREFRELPDMTRGVTVIIMVKGNNEDIFTPVLWGTTKGIDYWCVVAKIDLLVHICLMEGYCVGALK